MDEHVASSSEIARSKVCAGRRFSFGRNKRRARQAGLPTGQDSALIYKDSFSILDLQSQAGIFQRYIRLKSEIGKSRCRAPEIKHVLTRDGFLLAISYVHGFYFGDAFRYFRSGDHEVCKYRNLGSVEPCAMFDCGIRHYDADLYMEPELVDDK